MERRGFVKTAAMLAAAQAPFPGRVLGANDRIGIGQIGLGARGYYELTLSKPMSDVNIVAVCDPYDALVRQARAFAGSTTEGYADFRRLLERKDIDAVFVSTPDHWHAPISVMACQAGKDVYCEKPLTHVQSEGRIMIAAAEKHRRVTQTGSQQRSSPQFAEVRELVRAGHVGKVYYVECWNGAYDFPEGCGDAPDSAAPAGLDWDLYLGPAPKRPYNRARFIWHYRWFWDYSGGMMTDWGAHHLDSIHQIMDVTAPLRVSATGARLLQDRRETPDFGHALFHYPGFTASYTHSNSSTATPMGKRYGMLFHGTLGSIFVDRSGYEVLPERRRQGARADADIVLASLRGRDLEKAVEAMGWPLSSANPGEAQPQCEAKKATNIRIDPDYQIAHIRNWLDAIRTRRETAAPFRIGHQAVTACHLGVISYRLGRPVEWDAAKETISGDKEARRMLAKEYRAPYDLPRA